MRLDNSGASKGFYMRYCSAGVGFMGAGLPVFYRLLERYVGVLLLN